MKAQSFLPSAIVVLILMLQLTFAEPPRYEVIDLGTLGGLRSAGRSINDKGQVVGYAENSLGLERATLFDPTGNGNNIDLGTLDGQYSKANSINRDGQIVGQASTVSGYFHATLFQPTGGGNNIDLGTLGGYRSKASSINNNGQIVGWAQIASGERHATLFDPTGGKDNIDLGTLGGDESWASSINNSSQMVGTAYRLFTSPGGRFPPVTSSYPRATLFDPTGQGNNIDLGALLYILGGRYCSGAMSINDSGKIVGAAWNEDPFPFGQEMAVLFDPTGGENNIFLGTLGWIGSCAYSINNRDQIIGWGGICSNNLCGTRPALFDPNGFDPNGFFPTIQGNNVNLYDLIDPCCGWFLKEVLSINDSGWIVGEGINPAGKHHAFLLKPLPPIILYVDDDAAGANDGSSWAYAYNYLQDALTAAWYGDEIRVAQGTYKPDQGAGQTPGDREATFQLINGVTIKGGYAGEGTPDPNARDIELYETILSADLNGDDAYVPEPPDLRLEPTRSENARHVVVASDTDETAVLDGFTITGANGARYGGGMANDNACPTILNCTFRENSGNYNGEGTGMYNYASSPTLTNCAFIRNGASWPGGGGMRNNYGSSPTLTNCVFIGNTANSRAFEHGEGSGGAMVNWEYSDPTLINCLFFNNSASDDSGAIRSAANGVSRPVLVNCTFAGNSCGRRGGAIFCDHGSDTTLTNCIFWGNSDTSGTGESAQISGATMGTLMINYCCVQGWTGDLGGVGNIGNNPMFLDVSNADFHLQFASPCIDVGDNNSLPPDTADLDGDGNTTEPVAWDLDDKPRVMGRRIDMGAYEYSPPILVEARILPHTLNLSSKGKWITCYIWLPDECSVADIDPNSILLENEIEPEWFWLNEDQKIAIAKFDREDVQSILEVGDISIKITGQLTDGTVFEATDIVQVTDKGGGQSAK